MNCKNCGQPLIEIEFSKHYALVCDNWHCQMYRERQGSREKNPTPIGVLTEKKLPLSKLSPVRYQQVLQVRKERYQYARSLGIESRQAMLLRGKPMKYLKSLAGDEV